MTLKELRFPLAALAAGVLFVAAHAEVTEQFTHTYPLTAGGSVQLHNLNGSVEVVTWDRNEVRVEAEKFAKDAALLTLIDIRIEDEPSRIEIRTKHERDKDDGWWGRQNRNHGGVRYRLTVPASLAHLKVDVMNSNVTVENLHANLKIATMNGRIRATGLAGNANLDTMNGTIFASFDSVKSGQSISLDTMNGTCTLEVPENTGAEVRASTMNGRVRAELPITIERKTKRTLRGTLGQGGASIVLDSMNGSLTLRGRS